MCTSISAFCEHLRHVLICDFLLSQYKYQFWYSKDDFFNQYFYTGLTRCKNVVSIWSNSSEAAPQSIQFWASFHSTYSSSSHSCQLGNRCTKGTKITQTGGVTEQRQCFLCPSLRVDAFYSAVLFSSFFLFLTTNLIRKYMNVRALNFLLQIEVMNKIKSSSYPLANIKHRYSLLSNQYPA